MAAPILEDGEILETPPDDLQRRGQTVRAHARRHRERRALRHVVEDESHVVREHLAVRCLAKLFRIRPGRVGRDGRCRRADQRIVIGEDVTQALPLPGPDELQALETDGIHLPGRLEHGDDVRVEIVSSGVEMLLEECGEVDVPVVEPGIGALPPPSEIHFLDDGPGTGERLCTTLHVGRHLIVDVIETKVDIHGDPHAFDIAWQRLGNVQGRRVRHDVVLVRPLADVEKEGRIIQGPGQGPEVADVVEDRREDGHGDPAQTSA